MTLTVYYSSAEITQRFWTSQICPALHASRRYPTELSNCPAWQDRYPTALDKCPAQSDTYPVQQGTWKAKSDTYPVQQGTWKAKSDTYAKRAEQGNW